VQPERDIRTLLDDIAWRMRVATMARSVAVGVLVAVGIGLLPVWSSIQERAIVMGLTAALAAGSFLAWRTSSVTRRAAAATLERRHVNLQNVAITAEELIAHPERASGWMRDRVLRDAGARTAGCDPTATVELRRPLLLMVLAIGVSIPVLLLDPARMIREAVHRADSWTQAEQGAAVAAWRLEIAVEPPAYTRLPPRDEVDPSDLVVVAGTRLHLRLAGSAGPMRMRFGTDELPVHDESDIVLVATTVLRESGYLAIEPVAGEGERRLIPVRVTPDRAPVIRIETPGRDLLLPPAAPPVPITAIAHDDFGLDLLEIRYTKVSGSGEQFEFEEGTLPARVNRASGREWRAEADLPVADLKLGPGDSVVYRAVARDARPGEQGLATSDTFFVEIQGRGYVLLEGLEMPPDEERYALSQQMVVLKIERLQAREKTMTAEALRDEAARIAAEQRSVRANFIFLTGGHVDDEEEEAEHSHEIQEGRLENSARREISTAIHYMTAAEHGLTAVSTAQALPPARAAVDALQRAFGRNRYLLRSLAVQSRIDPSRRLTGKLEAASDWARDLDEPVEDAVAAATRGLLAGLLRVGAALADGDIVEPARLATLAEQALAIDPAAPRWQAVAQDILALREALAANEMPEAVRARLRRATAPVSEAVQEAARAAAGPGLRPASPLERAWGEEVRR
jgi:hypothetical protein